MDFLGSSHCHPIFCIRRRHREIFSTRKDAALSPHGERRGDVVPDKDGSSPHRASDQGELFTSTVHSQHFLLTLKFPQMIQILDFGPPQQGQSLN